MQKLRTWRVSQRKLFDSKPATGASDTPELSAIKKCYCGVVPVVENEFDGDVDNAFNWNSSDIRWFELPFLDSFNRCPVKAPETAGLACFDTCDDSFTVDVYTKNDSTFFVVGP